jgi:cbb3-type cytochrome oxidase maturation protein
MEVIFLLVILAISVAGGFLIAFFWATYDGQFDDTYSPAIRILIDPPAISGKENTQEISNEGLDKRS